MEEDEEDDPSLTYLLETSSIDLNILID